MRISRGRLTVLAIFAIALIPASRLILAAQSSSVLTADDVMTGQELKATGLSEASPAQRKAFDQWLSRYTQAVINITKGDREKDRSPSSASRGSSDCSPAVEANIDGDFSGWEGETIFKLSNGQIWQQAEYSYTYSYSYSPNVTIYRVNAGCRMKVEDEDESILVRRLK